MMSGRFLVVLFSAAVGALSSCGGDTSGRGKQGDPCSSVLDCADGLGCDPATDTCQPRPDGGAGPDGAGVDGGRDGGRPDGGWPDGGALDAASSDAGPDVVIPPSDGGVASCLYVPPPGAFSPQKKCYWESPTEYALYNDVVMPPVVANLTDDNDDGVIDTDDIPDVIFSSYRYQEDGCCNTDAVLRVVSGRCRPDASHLEEHFHIASPMLDNSAGLAVGDIDADGKPDIVGMSRSSGIVAFSSVLYDRAFPAGPGTHSGWIPWPGGLSHEVVRDDPPDDGASYLRDSGQDSRHSFPFAWSRTTKAIAMVRLVAIARAVGGDGELGLFLRKDGVDLGSIPTVLPAGGAFVKIVSEFPKNPFNGGLQWQDGDLSGIEYGIHRTDSGALTELQVTQLSLKVGYVVQKWISPDPQGTDALTAEQPAIVDLDRDGIAEILVGRVVLDGLTGAVKWRGVAGRGVNSFMGPISIAADLDLDGVMEVIAGNTAYRADGLELWTYDFGSDGSGQLCGSYPCDGFNATGNFDSDPEGEVVIVRDGMVYILEHDGQLLVKIPIPLDNCTRNEGGAPTVADFDADGEPEIGVAGADFYVVFDLECCDSLPACAAVPAGATQCESAGVRWSVPNHDCSSRATGSSVFDFDGDGAAEVVYNDECHFRIFRGDDGQILFEQPNHSHTRLEYTVIADVDNDGNAEIVFIENAWCSSGVANCPVEVCADPTQGIQIWGDANDRWVPTRRIWNQNSYHITNITEGGLLPPGGERPNWLHFNNYRQNLPDYNVFAAPDLTLTITGLGYSGCPARLRINASVCNLGDLRVGPGVTVTFYDETTFQPIACLAQVATQGTLNPGKCEAVSCDWPSPPIAPAQVTVRGCADNAGFSCAGPGQNNECEEDNNTDTTQGQGCSGGPG